LTFCLPFLCFSGKETPIKRQRNSKEEAKKRQRNTEETAPE
jgi:hypothetical protein